MPEQIFSGKYVVQEEIAKGGMGVIYKALDRTLNRIVAIKLVHAHLSGDSSFVERFLREARAMARLQHDNIVTIYAVEEDQQAQFLVMEFCAGTNLRALIRNQPRLSLRDAVSFSHQLSSALAYAHTQGIIHRDIKPANVLVDKKGKAKLTDFGIAAALDEASITSTGQVIGTPEYMSPEQARGVKLDGRSDLYSLGIMMYEMLTGRTPYAEVSKTAILGKLAYEQEELVLHFPSTIPSMLQGVVRDLLRRNPEERMPDAEILANQLHEILYTIPGSLPPPSPADSDATVLATPPRQTPPPPLPQTDDRTVFATSGGTKTSVLPDASKISRYPEPLSPPKHSPPPLALDETTILPTQLKHSLSRLSQPIGTSPSLSTPPSSPPPTPQTFRPMVLLGGGAALVLLLAGLVYMVANYGGASSDNAKPVISKKVDPPPPAQSVEGQQRTERERADQLQQLDRERKRLSDDQTRLEEKQRQADIQRKREEIEQRELATQRDRTAKDRELTAQRARADEERRKSQDTARLEQKRQAADADRRQMETEQQRLTRERDLAQQKSSPPPTAKVSPETQLQALLDRFRQAYERHDLGTLRLLSQLSDSRLRNVELMFSNYETIKTSVINVTSTDSGATATMVIDTAITATGETVSLPPIARTIKLQVPRQDDGWDKIVW